MEINMIHLGRLGAAAGVASLLALGGGLTVASATTTNSFRDASGVYWGCANNGSGALHLINNPVPYVVTTDGHTGNETCDHNETLVSWNAQGVAGLNGTDGTNGADGAQGPAGADGTNGAGGAQGPAGTDGTNGINGINGIKGVPGNNGTNGKDASTAVSAFSNSAPSTATAAPSTLGAPQTGADVPWVAGGGLFGAGLLGTLAALVARRRRSR